jgi:hypothetical protein
MLEECTAQFDQYAPLERRSRIGSFERVTLRRARYTGDHFGRGGSHLGLRNGVDTECPPPVDQEQRGFIETGAGIGRKWHA